MPSADTRYTFTGQFLEASVIFVRRARSIEEIDVSLIDDAVRSEHRGLITSVIIQCAAALETEAHEVCVHGPASYLVSNHTDHEAQRFLLPMADLIDDQSVPDRFNLILHLLHKPSLDKGTEPFQSAALVVKLRNEIVHYKSRWGAQMKSTKVYATIEALKHKPPPFTHASMNFFPHRCLSADCGAWALTSVVSFLESFYGALGVPSRFQDYRSRLVP